MNAYRRDGTVLEAIVREFAKRMQRSGQRLDLDVRIAEDFDGWNIYGHLSACVRGQWRTRHASVDVPARDLMVALARGDGEGVDFVNGHVRRLELMLQPHPLPVFRISTKPHAKRLQVAA